jgi:RNA polymerase-binding protein DksA
MTTLTARQTRQFERDLLVQRSGVLAEAHEEVVRATGQSYADIAGEVPDFGDQAMAASLSEYVNAVARRHVEAVKEIDDALSRVKSHDFGRCAECRAEISFDRLKAFPTARRCVPCQDMHDRTYAVAATPSL